MRLGTDQSADCLDQQRQGLGPGVGFQIGLHGTGNRLRQGFLQSADNLDPFDRINPEVGFQIGLNIQHVLRIAGALGNNIQHQRCHIQRRRGRCCRRLQFSFRDSLHRHFGLCLSTRRRRHGSELRSRGNGRIRAHLLARKRLTQRLGHNRFLQFQELLHGVLIGDQRITTEPSRRRCDQLIGKRRLRHGHGLRRGRLRHASCAGLFLVGLGQRRQQAVAAHLTGCRTGVAASHHPGGA